LPEGSFYKLTKLSTGSLGKQAGPIATPADVGDQRDKPGGKEWVGRTVSTAGLTRDWNVNL